MHEVKEKIKEKTNRPWFLYWLTAVFVASKLLGIVGWSWWVVLSPVILVFVVSAIWAIYELYQEGKQK